MTTEDLPGGDLSDGEKRTPIIAALALAEATPILYSLNVFLESTGPLRQYVPEERREVLMSLRGVMKTGLPIDRRIRTMFFARDEGVREELGESPTAFPLTYEQLFGFGQFSVKRRERVEFDTLKKAYISGGGRVDRELESLTYDVHTNEADIPPSLAATLDSPEFSDLLGNLKDSMRKLHELASEIELKAEYEEQDPSTDGN